jgi:hypothetical protein
LSQIGRWFGLSEQHGHGVSCDETGVLVGSVPLVEPCHGCAGLKKFRPRPLADINRDLSKRYGLPVEFDAKIEGLAAIARALDRGDVLYARIATLHLQIPDPPPLAKRCSTTFCDPIRSVIFKSLTNGSRRIRKIPTPTSIAISPG